MFLLKPNLYSISDHGNGLFIMERLFSNDFYMIFLKIHWPVRMKKGSVGVSPENFLPVDIPSTWKAMEALYDSGKARAIGVSNFSTKKLGNLLDLARVPPAVNQVECHPSWRQAKLREFCKSKRVHLSVSITHLTDRCTCLCVS